MWTLGLLVCVSLALAARPPNILLLVADDLGYGDLSCFGRQNISSPHIDSLARDGIRFTQFLTAAPICTPSRAGMLTGRLPRRFGMTANTLPWRVMVWLAQPGGFPHDELTMAEVLRDGGYATGMSGKWHLGLGTKEDHHAHLPPSHGFDSYLGIPLTNMPYCHPDQSDESKQYCILMANNTIVEQPTIYSNLTSVLTQHAVDFIDGHAQGEKPFFFYMSFMHVHTPLFTSPAFVNVSQGGRFGDNLEEMDWAVGRILAALDANNIANDTLIFFFSDNGPYAEEGWDNCGRTTFAPGQRLKGSKGQTYEGGIRVPGLARWPGTIPAGVVSDNVVSALDLFPTALSVAGIPLPTDRVFDGLDISAMLRNPSLPSPHEYIWHYCGYNVTAARHGNYKFHFATANWSTTFTPSAKCEECCPDAPTAQFGGSMCDCAENDLIFHDPPLIYDMSRDRGETMPLTPATMPDYDQEIAAVRAQLKLHYDGVAPAPDQMHTAPELELAPCCNGVWPISSCECNNYIPGHVYP
eukprot:m.5308 g.5308  ORF g.5308 m.5308 type:complete len:524 (+) comp1994_c0_seq1:10-1581(+)